jgi:D-alanyl-D-alanine dipeptidase
VTGRLEHVDDVLLLSDPRVAAVPVRECGAPLDDVRDGRSLLVDARKQDPDGAWARLRRGLAARLVEAQALLPDGLRLLVVEGYRPPALQQRYFAEHRDELRALHPDLPEAEIHRLTSRYIAPPEVAPHPAGAAVDLTLATADGAELDLGTRVNADPEESGGRCFTASPDIGPEAREHRRVLATALSAVGLVNYPTEWWHWSFGDRYWAVVTGAPAACHGPARMGSVR